MCRKVIGTFLQASITFCHVPATFWTFSLVCWAAMTTKEPSNRVSYAQYLGLEKVLDSQVAESKKAGREAHDETLFIIVHQVYELWFKQILHELDWVLANFSKDTLADEHMGLCVAKLERVVRIQKLMLEQVDVLETMTPMDFLDFRDLLYPASGFQSYQFRILENTLGLKREKRLQYDNESYLGRIEKEFQERVVKSEQGPSIFSMVERWLERTPFVQISDYSFWKEYRSAVDKMLAADEKRIKDNPHLNEDAKKIQLSQLEKTRASFETLYDPKKLETAITENKWRLSHKATLAALFILLYRSEPALQLPQKLIGLLTDIDENLTMWRYRHAQMAMRMIGTKIGTGGSSGAEYLAQATQSHRVFSDFSKMATFLIPRRLLPELPDSLKTRLAFHYQVAP
jgi:tryptophan 2,3-dioxygenase